MPNRMQSANLRLCETRAAIPGGSREEREREFAHSMRHQGLYLVKAELDRAAMVDRAPDGFFHRLQQAIDLLLGRGNVWVERRRSPRH